MLVFFFGKRFFFLAPVLKAIVLVFFFLFGAPGAGLIGDAALSAKQTGSGLGISEGGGVLGGGGVSGEGGGGGLGERGSFLEGGEEKRTVFVGQGCFPVERSASQLMRGISFFLDICCLV